MRPNRVRTALEALGGCGTCADIAKFLRVRSGVISAQLAGMHKRGDVSVMGVIPVRAKRWNTERMIEAKLWKI